MQIQQIQSNSSTNNIQIPIFKASFVNNKAFRYLWIHSQKSPNFNQVADEFSKIKNGKFEIMEMKTHPNVRCTIFNHETNRQEYISLPALPYGKKYIFEYLMDKIKDRLQLFESKIDNSREAAIKEADKKLYARFTGENWERTVDTGILCDLINYSEKSNDYVKNVEDFVNSVDSTFEIYQEIFPYYTVMNQKTGVLQEFTFENDVKYTLEYLLEQIKKSDVLSKPNNNTEGYKKLIGIN